MAWRSSTGSLLGPYAKTQRRGFLAAPEVLPENSRKSPNRRRGRRTIARLFLFLSPDCGRRREWQLARLTSFVASERIAVHGIPPQGSGGYAEFETLETLCMASEGGTFARRAPDQVSGEVRRIYTQPFNRFDVSYRMPEKSGPADGLIQITSTSGCGRATFRFY